MSTSKKIAALRSKTEARGATAEEAAAAAAKADQLENGTERAVEILTELKWSELQAKGMVSALDHLPPWRGPGTWRWPLLHDFASAHQKQDPTTLRTQLRFLTEDLGNALHAIGAAIRAASTEEEAEKAFKPYADQLAA